jgi:alpha-1,3/alpha-1,6-mannosyltransferase
MNRSLRIGWLHPDLGIGGAERLVVDAALQLQAAGHQVMLFTTYHDRTRCFEETRDGTLAVRVYGDFFPRQMGGRLLAFWAIVRMAYLTWAVALKQGPFDVIFCDLVAHTIPLLHRLSTARVVFYCHFPDQLLTPTRRGWYRWYRAPIDRLEERAIGMADRVLVNSRFTADVFRKTFPRLSLTPEVLYPGVDCTAYEAVVTEPSRDDDILLLSINRYERKKNIALALEALALARTQLDPHLFAKVQLVIAGGYDERLHDNRDTFRALQARACELGLTGHVVFLRSVSTQERLALLAQCRTVVYTPENEHFGYVPLEAMAAGRPVVAVNSGGPQETIGHGETGLLCEPTPAAFAAALSRLIINRDEARRMGQAGRAHIVRHFSHAIFGSRLNQIVNDLLASSPTHRCSAL